MRINYLPLLSTTVSVRPGYYDKQFINVVSRLYRLVRQTGFAAYLAQLVVCGLKERVENALTARTDVVLTACAASLSQKLRRFAMVKALLRIAIDTFCKIKWLSSRRSM